MCVEIFYNNKMWNCSLIANLFLINIQFAKTVWSFFLLNEAYLALMYGSEFPMLEIFDSQLL